MEPDHRKVLLAAAVMFVATGTGFFLGEQISGYERPDLYSEEFNITLNQDRSEQTAEFDNRSVDLIYESWNEFRAYYDTGRYERRINTTSDGQVHTTTEVVTVEGASYRFRFRYRDDPEGFEGDYIRLYRIERIQ
jgi:hypothetical protein